MSWKHYHFVREKVFLGENKIECVETKDQVANRFTKGLNGTKFEDFKR